ncbi:MAG: response regulator [Planctomycetes bacterium]|nr:response regulator [Planctomycetota bacterium]
MSAVHDEHTGASKPAVVLIVDDVPENLELLGAWLEDLPEVEVLTAADGVEALEQVERGCPDLILLDVMMPRLSGFEVCRRLKADPATRSIPVAMVTVLGETSDRERASQCGADDFISQPVQREELIRRAERLLALGRLRHGQRQAADGP